MTPGWLLLKSNDLKNFLNLLKCLWRGACLHILYIQQRLRIELQNYILPGPISYQHALFSFWYIYLLNSLEDSTFEYYATHFFLTSSSIHLSDSTFVVRDTGHTDWLYVNNKIIINKSVAYSSQGSHTGKLDFWNWLAYCSTTDDVISIMLRQV